MRSLLLAVACAFGLASSVQAQEPLYGVNDFLGTWYGENEIIPAGQRRIVPVQIDISEVPSLRGPRRFNVRLVIRCVDRPSQICDLGTMQITPDEAVGQQLVARPPLPRSGSPLRPCDFVLILTSGVFRDGVYVRDRKHSLSYAAYPNRRICQPDQYSDATPTFGYVNRTPPARLELPPDARPGILPPIRPPS